MVVRPIPQLVAAAVRRTFSKVLPLIGPDQKPVLLLQKGRRRRKTSPKAADAAATPADSNEAAAEAKKADRAPQKATEGGKPEPRKKKAGGKPRRRTKRSRSAGPSAEVTPKLATATAA
jgi:hypothetical protein